MKYASPIILFLLLATSCTTLQICDDSNETVLVARLKTFQDGETRDTLVQGMDIWGYREGENMGLLYDSATASRLELPLDPSATESRFILSTLESRDTLVIVHEGGAYLISYECGFAMRFFIQEARAAMSWIRDVEIIRDDVDEETETNEEHIRIFF